MKRLIIDLDNTLCITEDGDYLNSTPVVEVVEKMRWYKSQGFEIAISTSRNMRTYDGCVGKINANTLPWCGHDGFYIDDRAVRPSEFVSLSYEEILARLGPHL